MILDPKKLPGLHLHYVRQVMVQNNDGTERKVWRGESPTLVCPPEDEPRPTPEGAESGVEY